MSCWIALSHGTSIKCSHFSPALLTGIQAQRYQIDLPAGFAAAQTRMAGKIDKAIRQDIGGNKQRIYSKTPVT